MSFLAPWALWAAGAVSAAVIALHVLASRNPRVTPLPTTRFIPDAPLRATARTRRLSDLPLLLLRVSVILLAGLALARPVSTHTRRAVGRVLMVDVSRAVRSGREGADSASRLMQRGDVLIAFDSSARRIAGATADSLRRLQSDSLHRTSGSLSAALAAGMRAASSLRSDADSVELVLVSPAAASEWDAATNAIRAMWPGRVRLVRVASRDTSVGAPAPVEVRSAPLDDPIRAAVSLNAGTPRAAAPLAATVALTRIDRGAPAAADTAWALGSGHTLVRWPASLDSSGWRARSRQDTAGAVLAVDAAPGAVVVAPFVRTVNVAPGTVIARWSDGAAAATERVAGAGCVRDVAIPIPRAGDLALRESARRLVAALTAPCGGALSFAPVSDSALARLRGTGSLVATSALAARTAPSGHLATWLLAAALVLLLLEPLLRRQRAIA